jgi:ATP-binding cassette subfamily B protein
MAPKLPSSDKPPSSDDPKPAAAGDPVAPVLDEKLAADAGSGHRPAGEKAPKPSEHDLEIDDDDDEDLVVYTAQEAAGAFATIYAFIQPFLKNYRKMLAFVSIGVVIETLFNVIMPLSLKFLIDDALGEEDFQALYMILGVLAVAGIITSIVAIWYERWDAKLASSLIADVRSRLFGHVQDLPSGYFARTQRGEILSRFSIDLSAFETSIKSFANSAALPFLELIAGIILMLFLNWQLAAVALLVFPITLIGPRLLTPKAVQANYDQKLHESSLLRRWSRPSACNAGPSAGSACATIWFATRPLRRYSSRPWSSARSRSRCCCCTSWCSRSAPISPPRGRLRSVPS